MEKFEEIVQNWYDRNEGDIDYDTRLLYFIELFQELKEADIQKSQISEVGERVLFLLDQDFIDESIHMIYQRRVAEEINYAYRSVMRNIEEIEDESTSIEDIPKTNDGDIYPNNTSEPDIDLRGVDLGEVTFDETFIKELGLKNE